MALIDVFKIAPDMSKDCGICGIYPRWLRNRATPKNFIAVYGLLGTVQAMAFIYIVVTLTTLEKRFKIPSRTTGRSYAKVCISSRDNNLDDNSVALRFRIYSRSAVGIPSRSIGNRSIDPGVAANR